LHRRDCGEDGSNLRWSWSKYINENYNDVHNAFIGQERGVPTRQAVMKREGQLGTAIDFTFEQWLLVV
jgi:hypothetical protein